jgi:hypothetical protein
MPAKAGAPLLALHYGTTTIRVPGALFASPMAQVVFRYMLLSGMRTGRSKKEVNEEIF